MKRFVSIVVEKNENTYEDLEKSSTRKCNR